MTDSKQDVASDFGKSNLSFRKKNVFLLRFLFYHGSFCINLMQILMTEFLGIFSLKFAPSRCGACV